MSRIKFFFFLLPIKRKTTISHTKRKVPGNNKITGIVQGAAIRQNVFIRLRGVIKVIP